MSMVDLPFENERNPFYCPAVVGAVHAIKWAVQRARYITLESIAPLGDDQLLKLPAVAA